MRAPLSWIRDFTPIEAPPADVADALNQLGLEVEAIEEPGRDVNGVVVARILDVVPHPDADRIRLADVDFGSGQVRVVCGAPNIEPGMVKWLAFAGGYGHLRYRGIHWQPVPIDRAIRLDVRKVGAKSEQEVM